MVRRSLRARNIKMFVLSEANGLPNNVFLQCLLLHGTLISSRIPQHTVQGMSQTLFPVAVLLTQFQFKWID